EAAKGQGMQTSGIFWRVRMPLAWPVIITGIRVATQMSMGVAAIAAYVLGPGLGGYIFTGLAQVGGANAMNYALVGTIGIIILAILVDAVLAVIARITTSKGIRACASTKIPVPRLSWWMWSKNIRAKPNPPCAA